MGAPMTIHPKLQTSPNHSLLQPLPSWNLPRCAQQLTKAALQLDERYKNAWRTNN